MTDRDDELARRLGEVGPPDHGPQFWSSLRRGLANSTGHGSGAEPDLVENEDRANSTDQGSGAEPDFVENEGVVELAECRDRRRVAPGWMVAAVVALVALVSGALVLSTDRDADVATDPSIVEPSPDTTVDEEVTTTTTAITTTAVAGPLRAGEPAERGSGEVVAVDPTGRFLYVSAPAPEGGQGCEGVDRRALFVEPVDGGGERRLVAPVDLVDGTGAVAIRFSDAGEVAIVASCEGFGSGVVTGTLGPDGTLTDPVQLELPGVENIFDIEFLTPGVLAVATYVPDGGGSDHRVYEFPVGPSEPTDLGYDDVSRFEVLDDGRLLTVSTGGGVRLGEDALGSAPGALDLQVTPDGRWAVVHTTDGVFAFGTDGSGGRRLDIGAFTSAIGVTAQGTVLAEEVVGDEQHLRLVEADPETGARIGTVFEAGRLGRGFALTPSDDRLFVGVAEVDGPPDGSVVLEVPLAR